MMLFVRVYFTRHVTESCLSCICVVQRQKLLFACMVWFTFMYFFWKLGDPFPILSPKHGEKATFTCVIYDCAPESDVSLLNCSL